MTENCEHLAIGILRLEALYPRSVIAYAAAMVENLRVMSCMVYVHDCTRTRLLVAKIRRISCLTRSTDTYLARVAECLENPLFLELI